MQKTRAVAVIGEGHVAIVERHITSLDDTQVLIRVTQAGICGSDVDKYLGLDPNLPNPTGHEIAGEVIQTGSRVTNVQTGDHVVAWTPTGGGMAELYAAEARYCIPVDPGIAFPAAAEPLACVVNTIDAAQPRVGDVVAIVGGTGFMGLMLVQLSRLAGARKIIVAGRRQNGLDRAAEHGATHVVNTATTDLETVIDEITAGYGVDVAYELTGRTDGLTLAGQIAHRGNTDTNGGTVVIAGYHQGEPRPTEWGLWNGAGLNVVNAHFRPDWQCMAGMHRAVTLLQHHMIDPGPFTTFTLDQVQDAFQAAARRDPSFHKAVVTPA